MQQPSSTTCWLPALLVWSAVLLSLLLQDQTPRDVVLAKAAIPCAPQRD